uniref:pectinesterase inhibitor 11-like n=1 Tax=Erigeron canadensis TaxID=72917 RepID=UPI001CB88E1F|nr:pectinesterase inhibitor 11-like [Erigeron canadensis]
MENVCFYCLLLLLVSLGCTSSIISGATATSAPNTAVDFIKASCKSTLHPALCVTCLSRYAASIRESDHHLAQAAISVSLNHAKSASAFILRIRSSSSGGSMIKHREYQAVKDCVSTIANSVASLSRSVQEFQKIMADGQDFEWHMSNVETWVSSALTNQNICGRGFANSMMNGHVKDMVTKRMVYVSQVTSNALALVNRFAARHRS